MPQDRRMIYLNQKSKNRTTVSAMGLFFRLVTATFPEAEVVLDKRDTEIKECFQPRKTKTTEDPRLNRRLRKPKPHSCPYTSYKIKLINWPFSRKTNTNLVCPNQSLETQLIFWNLRPFCLSSAYIWNAYLINCWKQHLSFLLTRQMFQSSFRQHVQ